GHDRTDRRRRRSRQPGGGCGRQAPGQGEVAVRGRLRAAREEQGGGEVTGAAAENGRAGRDTRPARFSFRNTYCPSGAPAPRLAWRATMQAVCRRRPRRERRGSFGGYSRMTDRVTDNPEKSRFELRIDGQVVFADYRRRDSTLVIPHV